MMPLLACCLQLNAEGVKTAGDGTTYNLEKLSAMENTGVEKWVDDDNGEVTYMLLANDTIAAGDRFVMDDGVIVMFDDEVTLVIEGEADFQLEKGSTFDSAFDDAGYVSPVGIKIGNEVSQTVVENCHFNFVGLRCTSSKGMKVRHSAFYNNNTAIGQAALTLGSSTAPFTIEDCTFAYNRKAAIAGAANFYNPLHIRNCTFIANGQANGNTPQLNLTVADSVVIEGCAIEGDTTLTMVGGIGVSNFSAVGGSKVVVRNCHIRNNRYGIGTVGPVNVVIENNTMTNNHYETNAMNGGSGISLYDPYMQTVARICGNHIEGSLWGITVIGCNDVNIGRTDVDQDDEHYNPGLNTFVNNGNGGQLYDLYNNSTITVYAQGNRWNVSEQTEEMIESVVFHQNDDSKLGKVIFMPAASPSGIASTQDDRRGANSVYNLYGQPVRTAQHGIYIVNGRKVVR